MKRILTLFLTVVLCLSCFTACRDKKDDPSVTSDIETTPVVTTGDPTPPEPSWNDDNTLQILCIGNSYSSDMMTYVYDIAKDAGVENVVLGNLYVGGCTLEGHDLFTKEDQAVYTYFKNTNGTWETNPNYKVSTALAAEDWDFVTMQEGSARSGITETYSFLPALIDYVKERVPETTKLVWHMTWAYQQDIAHSSFPSYDNDQMTMYNAILNAYNTCVLPEEDIVGLIPSGTALQNARTSYYGDAFCVDIYCHLGYLGDYIAGLTAVKALTGLSIDNVTFLPPEVPEAHRAMAIESANNACEKPFEVTNSAYPPEIDLSNGKNSVIENMNWNDDGSLNILCIGNSFSENTLYYAWEIAKDAGIENVVVANMYVGGCSLDMHLQYAKGFIGAYLFKYKQNGEWVQRNGTTIDYALKQFDWDYIVFQQVSQSSGVESTFTPLAELVDYVKARSGENIKYVWLSTWAYQQDATHTGFANYNNDQTTMYNAILNATKNCALANENIVAMVPAGTAIQNVRTSFVGDTITLDGYHLGKYGAFVAGLSFIRTLSGMPIDNVTSPDAEITPTLLEVAIEAANNAYETPFEVTPSAHVTEG